MHYEYAVFKAKCVACPPHLLLITNTDAKNVGIIVIPFFATGY